MRTIDALKCISRWLVQPPLRKGCEIMVGLLLEGKSLDEIHAELRRMGYSDCRAARIVTLLPSAFARVYHRRSGYRFSDVFFDGVAAFEANRLSSYQKEAAFNAAIEVAEKLEQMGKKEIVEKITTLSAEHLAIIEARTKGLTPVESSIVIHTF